MKFTEFKYERPNYDRVKIELESLFTKLNRATDGVEFKCYFDMINEIRKHVQTMASLASVRNTIYTSDKYYDEEKEYWDEISPLYAELDNVLYKTVLNSKVDLTNVVPEAFIKIAECAIKSFDPIIVPLLQQENKLISQQAKLYASAKIEFDQEVYNLSSIKAKLVDQNRDIRKRALIAKMHWFKENQLEIDQIYDQMVKVRTEMAHKLGFKNYVELGYLRMMRLDYDQEMVKTYRHEVKKYLVPLDQEIIARQAKRLNLEKLKIYDEQMEFLSGNPKPIHTAKIMIEKAQQMYEEMSSETHEFFDKMVEMELFDLLAKPNKAGGGYCTDFPDYKVPFIFSNFNGTSADVDVLTHEAGHAFQSYLSQKTITVPECMFPTMESAEIHSMSMEFFAYPWMNLFFADDTQKYYYLHMTSALKFIPYGILVDHFQHEVYEKYDMSIDERKQTWLRLEKEYLPHRDNDGIEILSEGCYWYQQNHIFQSPFYYIDYTLAQVCAFQFWNRQYNKDKEVWNDYLRLCKLGGTKTFLNLLKEANLKSPFVEGTISSAIENCSKFLTTIDDLNM